MYKRWVDSIYGLKNSTQKIILVYEYIDLNSQSYEKVLGELRTRM